MSIFKKFTSLFDAPSSPSSSTPATPPAPKSSPPSVAQAAKPAAKTVAKSAPGGGTTAPVKSTTKAKAAAIPAAKTQPAPPAKAATAKAIAHVTGTGGSGPTTTTAAAALVDTQKLPGIKQADGSVFDGTWDPDTLQFAQGRLTFPSGVILEGKWNAQGQFVEGKQTLADGIIKEGHFYPLSKAPGVKPEQVILRKGKVFAPTYTHDGEYDEKGNICRGLRVGLTDHITLEGEFGVASTNVIRLKNGKQTLSNGSVFVGSFDLETGRWIEGSLTNSKAGTYSCGLWSYAWKYPHVYEGLMMWKDGRFRGRRDPVTGDWLEGRYDCTAVVSAGLWGKSPTTGKATMVLGAKYFQTNKALEDGIFDSETTRLVYGRRIPNHRGTTAATTPPAADSSATSEAKAVALPSERHYEGFFEAIKTGKFLRGMVYDAEAKTSRPFGGGEELIAGLDTVSNFIPYCQWVIRIPSSSSSGTPSSSPPASKPAATTKRNKTTAANAAAPVVEGSSPAKDVREGTVSTDSASASEVHCPAGHILEIRVSSPSALICNGCNVSRAMSTVGVKGATVSSSESLVAESEQWRGCPKCNFDLCGKCFRANCKPESAVPKPANSTGPTSTTASQAAATVEYEDKILSVQENFLLEKAFLCNELRCTLTLQGVKETVDLTLLRAKTTGFRLKRRLLSVPEAMQGAAPVSVAPPKDIVVAEASSSPGAEAAKRPSQPLPAPSLYHRHSVVMGFPHHQWMVFSTRDVLPACCCVELEVALFHGKAELIVEVGQEFAQKVTMALIKLPARHKYGGPSDITVTLRAESEPAAVSSTPVSLPMEDRQPDAANKETKYESEKAAALEDTHQRDAATSLVSAEPSSSSPGVVSLALVNLRSFPRELELLHASGTRTGIKATLLRLPTLVEDWVCSATHRSAFLQLNQTPSGSGPSLLSPQQAIELIVSASQKKDLTIELPTSGAFDSAEAASVETAGCTLSVGSKDDKGIKSTKLRLPPFVVRDRSTSKDGPIASSAQVGTIPSENTFNPRSGAMGLSISDPIAIPCFDDWTKPGMMHRLQLIAHFHCCIAIFPFHENYSSEDIQTIMAIAEHYAVPIQFWGPLEQEKYRLKKEKERPPTLHVDCVNSGRSPLSATSSSPKSTSSVSALRQPAVVSPKSQQDIASNRLRQYAFTITVYFIGSQSDVGSCGFMALKWQTNAGIIKPPPHWVTPYSTSSSTATADHPADTKEGAERKEDSCSASMDEKIIASANQRLPEQPQSELLEGSFCDNSSTASAASPMLSFFGRDASVTQANFEEQNNYLFPVAPETDEYKEVVARFAQNSFLKEVTKVERVQNFYLYEKYVVHRRQVAKESGGDPNEERWLIHGTRKTDPETIISNGFDLRYSDQGYYGRASYFAFNSAYSHTYRHTLPDLKHAQLFLALVTCGLVEHRKEKSQTIRHPTPPFHSIRGPVATGQDAIMIYELHQAYPAYLVTYKE